MIHIRNDEYSGVEYAVEYDPEHKKFSSLPFFRREPITSSTEYGLIREVKKAIDARGKNRKRIKPSITFFGSTGLNGAPQVLTYCGVDLRSGDVILKDESGERTDAREIHLIDPKMQGPIAMAHAARKAAIREHSRLMKEHGRRIRTPCTTSYGDSADRTLRNLKAEEALTKLIREGL